MTDHSTQQMIVFLRSTNGHRDEADRIQYAMNVIDAYSYAKVLAKWGGHYDGHDGVYAVLEGEKFHLDSTLNRLASGLHFAHVLVENVEEAWA
jgi:hypothetical protein